MDTKSITQHVMFWLLIAFIAGFGFNEVLTRTGVNPLRSSAFAPSDTTIFCGPGGNAQAMGYSCSGFNGFQRVIVPGNQSTIETGPYFGNDYIPVMRDRDGNPLP